MGIAYELEHVKEIREFVQRGVMVTPALVIDGTVVVAGRLPSTAELMRWIGSAAAR